MRLKRGLLQSEVATIIGVRETTVNAWETGRDEPKVSYIPPILAFLGYEPFSGAETLGERLRAERWRRGLSQAKAAELLGVANTTIQKLEEGGETEDGRVLEAVGEFVREEGEE